MKKTIVALSLSLACAAMACPQKTETRAIGDVSNQTSVAISRANKSINLDSGTRLTAELQNAIDVRKARVDDTVVLKTTQAIKSEGHTIVGKGTRLVGHVTEVTRGGKGNSESRVGILFDRLEQGSLTLPISATIRSITSGRASANANKVDLFGSNTSASARSTSSARSSSGGGGLLGGAGGVVNSTTSTVGTVVGGTTSALGSSVDSTTNAIGNTETGLVARSGAFRFPSRAILQSLGEQSCRYGVISSG